MCRKLNKAKNLGIGQLQKAVEVMSGCKHEVASDSSCVQCELKSRSRLKSVTDHLFRGRSVPRALRKVPGFSEQLLDRCVGCFAKHHIAVSNGVEWFWPRDHNQPIHRLLQF